MSTFQIIKKESKGGIRDIILKTEVTTYMY